MPDLNTEDIQKLSTILSSLQSQQQPIQPSQVPQQNIFDLANIFNVGVQTIKSALPIIVSLAPYLLMLGGKKNLNLVKLLKKALKKPKNLTKNEWSILSKYSGLSVKVIKRKLI